MLFDPQLNEAKQLIDVGDEQSAKAIVVPYLQKNPQSADGWWLFAILTDTNADEILALQRVLEIDPTHYEAKRSLDRLQKKLGTTPQSDTKDEEKTASSTFASSERTKPPEKAASSLPPKQPVGSFEVTGEQVGKPKTFPVKEQPQTQRPSGSAERVARFSQTAPSAMEAVARAYSTYGWTAVQYNAERTIMQKKTGFSWFWGILTLPVPLLGLTLLAINFFIRRTYTINITSQGQKLRFDGNVKSITLDQSAIMAGQVALPMPEINTNYLGAIIAGVVASFLVVCALCVGLLFLAAESEDFGDTLTDFDVGDTVFALSDETKCIDVFRLPGGESPISSQLPRGEQVTLTRRVEREDLSEVWYEVRGLDSGITGWLPASNVGNELNNISLPPAPCN